MATQFAFANLFTDYLNIEQAQSYTHLVLVLFIDFFFFTNFVFQTIRINGIVTYKTQLHCF